MQRPEGNFPPTQVPEALIEAFGDRLRLHFQAILPPDFSGFSSAVHEIVDRMVAPSARENYREASSIFRLVIGEICALGQRARRYQYIERYKFFVELPNPDMAMAFAEHLWTARSAEVYSFLERGESLIRFTSVLTDELNSGDNKSSSRFSKRFRKVFAYRLRERHRITHAHERPSLTSRILQIGELKTDQERETVQRTIGKLIVGIRNFFENMAEMDDVADAAPDPLDQVAFQQWYLRKSDLEALTMWELFSEAVATAAGMPEEAEPTKPTEPNPQQGTGI